MPTCCWHLDCFFLLRPPWSACAAVSLLPASCRGQRPSYLLLALGLLVLQLGELLLHALDLAPDELQALIDIGLRLHQVLLDQDWPHQLVNICVLFQKLELLQAAIKNTLR